MACCGRGGCRGRPMPPGFSCSSRRRDDPVFRRRGDGVFLSAGRGWTMVHRWRSLFKFRAAEKQKREVGGHGCYKQATPTGFQAVGGLATGRGTGNGDLDKVPVKKLLRSCG